MIHHQPIRLVNLRPATEIDPCVETHIGTEIIKYMANHTKTITG